MSCGYNFLANGTRISASTSGAGKLPHVKQVACDVVTISRAFCCVLAVNGRDSVIIVKHVIIQHPK